MAWTTQLGEFPHSGESLLWLNKATGRATWWDISPVPWRTWQFNCQFLVSTLGSLGCVCFHSLDAFGLLFFSIIVAPLFLWLGQFAVAVLSSSSCGFHFEYNLHLSYISKVDSLVVEAVGLFCDTPSLPDSSLSIA